MGITPRTRAKNKTPDEVYEEAVQQVAHAKESRATYLKLGKSRRSLHQIPDLSGLPHLRALEIRMARVTDLRPLQSLENLRRLILVDIAASDISPIASLSRIERLSIVSCPVTDIAAISALEKLENLVLSNIGITDLAALTGLQNLKDLHLSSVRVSNIEPLSNLPKLERLRLISTNISNLAPLASSRTLANLDLSYSEIVELESLRNLKTLTTLDISDTDVLDLKPIASLTNLENLRANRTKLSDLSAISGMTKLKQLALDYSGVTDLSPITKLGQLIRLDIDECPVSDLSPLATHVTMYKAASTFSPFTAGLWCSDCPLTNPTLLALSKTDNPKRTLEIIDFLRKEIGLPPIELGDQPESPPDIPGQGPGPHFAINDDGVIRFTSPTSVDSGGNNIGRLESLKPLLEDAANSLLNGLSKNEHPQLRKLVGDYLDEIQGGLDSIDFAKLYGVGLRLQNAAVAAERQISERLLPALEDPTREALDSLTNLHGPFILSTKDGLELIEIAERYRSDREAERELRDAASQLGTELQLEPEIIDHDVATFVKEIAEEIDRGNQPERGTTYGLGTARNVSIVLVAGATCGAFPLIGGVVGGFPGAILGGIAALIGVEGLKKSKPFEHVRGQVTERIDKVTDADLKILFEQKASTYGPHLKFVLAHEALLRRLAGDRIQFRWLHAYLDWLKKQASNN